MLSMTHHRASDYCTPIGFPWGSVLLLFNFISFLSLPELSGLNVHAHTRKRTHKHIHLPALQMVVANVTLSEAIKRLRCSKACVERLHPTHMDVSAVFRTTTTCINFGFTPSALMATKRWETITGHGAVPNDGWKHYTMTENLPWASEAAVLLCP